MEAFVTILIVISAVLLGLVVLIQNPKGGGLAVGFQGSTQIGGVQRTADFLEKATWFLAIALFVLCLLSAKWSTTSSTIEGGDDPQVEQTGGETTDGGDAGQ